MRPCADSCRCDARSSALMIAFDIPSTLKGVAQTEAPSPSISMLRFRHRGDPPERDHTAPMQTPQPHTTTRVSVHALGHDHELATKNSLILQLERYHRETAVPFLLPRLCDAAATPHAPPTHTHKESRCIQCRAGPVSRAPHRSVFPQASPFLQAPPVIRHGMVCHEKGARQGQFSLEMTPCIECCFVLVPCPDRVALSESESPEP